MFRDTGELVTTEHCLEVAARAGISACDAELVATAEALGVRLVTADRHLVRACPERAISLERFVAGD